jgi:hypothetical protein
MMVGQKFGKLTVIAYAESRGRRNREMITARCDCGTVIDVRPYDVRTGHTISCGCAKRDALTALHERARQRVLERCRRYQARLRGHRFDSSALRDYLSLALREEYRVGPPELVAETARAAAENSDRHDRIA